jgi:hypothetical protein
MAPLPGVAAERAGAGAVTFSSVDDLERFLDAAMKAGTARWYLMQSIRKNPPLPRARHEKLWKWWAEFDFQQRAYREMRLARPDILDSPDVLAEFARRRGRTVEQVQASLPWHSQRG